MPILKPAPLDVPNIASKLPESLQWPVGAMLGGLKSAFGGDDPASAASALAPSPLMAAEGPILRGLGAVNPFYTAAGEEGAFNAVRPVAQAADPAEAAYTRMMSNGVANPGTAAGRTGAIGSTGQGPHPAIRALLDSLSQQPEGADPVKTFAGDKVGGFQIPHRSMIVPPDGFELPADTSAFPARDPSLIDAFTQRRDSGLGRASDYTLHGNNYPRPPRGPVAKPAPTGTTQVNVTPQGFESKFSTAGYK